LVKGFYLFENTAKSIHKEIFNNHPSCRPPTAFTIAERFQAGASAGGLQNPFFRPPAAVWWAGNMMRCFEQQMV